MNLGHYAIGHEPLGHSGGDSYNLPSTTGSFVVTAEPAPLELEYFTGVASFTFTGHFSTGEITLPAKTAEFNETTFGAPLIFSGASSLKPPVDNTGTSDDLLARVKRLIPGRWFSWAARR